MELVRVIGPKLNTGSVQYLHSISLKIDWAELSKTKESTCGNGKACPSAGNAIIMLVEVILQASF